MSAEDLIQESIELLKNDPRPEAADYITRAQQALVDYKHLEEPPPAAGEEPA